MNFDQFNNQYQHLRDVDRIDVDPLCDHPQHIAAGKQIGKGAAKRNILKHGGREFICRACDMRHNNPMNRTGGIRQTDEEIVVHCPHPEHVGDPARKMKKACYYGEMKEPYTQVCKSCGQLGKIISEDQRQKISAALTGIERSEVFKMVLSDYMKNNPEGIARATKNIIEHRGAGFLGKHHTPESKERISKTMIGLPLSDEHRRHISEGRKKWLAEQGGFTEDHLANITSANRLNGLRRRLQSCQEELAALQQELGLCCQRIPATTSKEARDERLRAMNRRRAKKHYDEKIATDTDLIFCPYCDDFHTPLRLTHDKNVARNGRYICEREGGHIAGSKPKPSLKKVNPYADEGMKECVKCYRVLPFDEFHLDRTRPDGRCGRCKGCRAGTSQGQHQKKQKATE